MPQALFTQAAIQVVAFFAGVPAGAVATATTVYGSYVAATAAILQFVTLTAASMGANKLLAPKTPGFSDASLADRTQMVRSPIAARQIVYGQSKVSGVLVYISTTGTKNEFLHMVIALLSLQRNLDLHLAAWRNLEQPWIRTCLNKQRIAIRAALARVHLRLRALVLPDNLVALGIHFHHTATWPAILTRDRKQIVAIR